MTKIFEQKRNILRTQEKILDAAHAEFRSLGIDLARIETIASRAGVSKQLVYFYYESKENLYSIVLDRTAQRFFDAFSALDFDNDPPLETLRAFIATLFHTSREWAGVITIDVSLHNGGPVGERRAAGRVTQAFLPKLSAVLERGKKEGSIEPAIDPIKFWGIALVVATGALRMPTVFSMTDPGLFPPESEADFWCAFATDVILRSICKPEFRDFTRIGRGSRQGLAVLTD
jgi:TetR/AcrR family transcriptional regulator